METMKFTSKQIIIGALFVVVAVGVYVVLDRWVWNGGLPEGLIQANGRIEGDHVTIASKFPGRVQELLVREGATVRAGQVLVRIDDSQIRSKVEQAKQAAAGLEAQVQAAHSNLAVLNLDVPLAIEAAAAQVAHAKAMVEKSLFVETEARSDAQRFRQLAEKDEASLQQRDQADMKKDVARKEVAAARSALAQATKQLAQAELGWKRISTQESEVAALERAFEKVHRRRADEAGDEQVGRVVIDAARLGDLLIVGEGTFHSSATCRYDTRRSDAYGMY